MAERVLAEGNGFVPEAMLPGCSARPATSTGQELVEKVTALILEQAPEAIAGAQRGMAARSATTDVLASIKVPTLVVTGEDAVTPDGSAATWPPGSPGPVPPGRGGWAPGQSGATGDRQRGARASSPRSGSEEQAP